MIRRDDIIECPTCEGPGTVIHLTRAGPERQRCPTCDGRGTLDAGVWPYEPFPHQKTAAGRPPAPLQRKP